MTTPELREQITATVEPTSQPRMDIQELEPGRDTNFIACTNYSPVARRHAEGSSIGAFSWRGLLARISRRRTSLAGSLAKFYASGTARFSDVLAL